MKTIKELKAGCGKERVTKWDSKPYRCGQIEDLKHSDSILLCEECKLKIETLKDVLKLINKMEHGDFQSSAEGYEFSNMEELKKRIKG